MERKIGDKFKDLGEKLVVFENEKDLCLITVDEEEHWCFYLDLDVDHCDFSVCGECSKANRTDKKSVVFLKE